MGNGMDGLQTVIFEICTHEANLLTKWFMIHRESWQGIDRDNATETL